MLNIYNTRELKESLKEFLMEQDDEFDSWYTSKCEASEILIGQFIEWLETH